VRLRAAVARHRFDLEELSESGGTVTATVVASFRGSLEGLGGSRTDGLTIQGQSRIRTRFRSDIDPRIHRLLVDGGPRRLEIQSADDPTGLREETLILAREIL
jgi:hypothetical protein